MSELIVVGGDKGGVGKTTVSRAVLEYLAAKEIETRPIDTETPNGTLAAFYPDKAQVIDLTRSDGQMVVLDSLHRYPVTLIDVRAGEMTNLLKVFQTVGLRSSAELRIVMLHIVGSNKASINEIQSTSALVKGIEHYLVLNHSNEARYENLTPELKAMAKSVIEIPKLDDNAFETIDGLSMPFNDFVGDQSKSFVLRGYTRSWLATVFNNFERAGIA